MDKNYKEMIDIAAEAAKQAPKDFVDVTYEIVLKHLLSISSLEGKMLYETSDNQVEHDKPIQDAFLSRLGLDKSRWETVFDEDGGCLHLIVRDLGVEKIADKQLRAALLLGLVKSWEDPETSFFDKKELRDLCAEYNCVNTNLSANLTKCKQWFRRLDRGKYKLTKPGEVAAAELVKELGGDTDDQD